LNLGIQELTGVFPASTGEEVTKGPLELVWCPESCLVQLRHTYDSDELYGDNYGYRSGLNRSMVEHLENMVEYFLKIIDLDNDDVVVDIGSNDGTLLKCYKQKNITKIGIDPTGNKFLEYYDDGTILVPEFFSYDSFRSQVPSKKAKIVTSIAMFYDLERPLDFVRQVAEILDDDGIWHFEQSYMPSMLRMNAYDTVCHEHIEYYSLMNIKYMLDRCGLNIIDVKMNAINGGSFAVTAAKKSNRLVSNDAIIDWLLAQERSAGLSTTSPFRLFEDRVFQHRNNLMELVQALCRAGKTIVGYGASTKGNVLLQFCGFTAKEIPCIAEINPDKFGKYTPGTHIPIVSEEEAKAINPDYLLVLPWHFKEGIIRREKDFLMKGGKLIFPLPEIEIY